MNKHMQATIFVFALAIAVVAVVEMLLNAGSLTGPYRPTSFTFNNVTYTFTGVEYTLAQQQRGLMNATVTNSTFMLYVFNSTRVYPFWMMDTYHPLDIIWINHSTVVYIVHAPPCISYSPDQTSCIVYNLYNNGHAANYVIETQEGFTNRTGMKVGSRISIN